MDYCVSKGLLAAKASASASASATKVGVNKCTYGPAYWCASVANANECSALAHCQSMGMLQDTTPAADNGVECSLCTWVMKELEGELSKNSTEAEIEKAVEEVCKILPSSIRPECDNLIQEYGPQIIALLLKDEPPATICSQLGLCSAAEISAAAEAAAATAPANMKLVKA
eukprot:m.8978 g.8978  ORF g.8978 m.8978 type:complete len:171 (+) comp5345_c0_seq1:2-514(+)